KSPSVFPSTALLAGAAVLLWVAGLPAARFVPAASGRRINTAVPLLLLSATLVAITVTVCCTEIAAGAVYTPVPDTDPIAGLIDQLTAAFAAFVTVAENCCVWDAYKVAVEGLTVTVTAAGVEKLSFPINAL